MRAQVLSDRARKSPLNRAEYSDSFQRAVPCLRSDLSHGGAEKRRCGRDYFAKSFRFFRGRTLTTRRAGLAANICSSLVKGLMPLRALVAGLLMTVIFIKPGTVKMPGPFLPTFFLICS